jgi:hypothetical protein
MSTPVEPGQLSKYSEALQAEQLAFNFSLPHDVQTCWMTKHAGSISRDKAKGALADYTPLTGSWVTNGGSITTTPQHILMASCVIN